MGLILVFTHNYSRIKFNLHKSNGDFGERRTTPPDEMVLTSNIQRRNLGTEPDDPIGNPERRTRKEKSR
jgi:hypothetical protein